MKKKILIFSIVFFIVDMLSKILFDKFLSIGKSINICDKFFYLTKVYNTGISFSMLSGQTIVIVILSILAMIFLFQYLKKFKESKRNIVAFSLVFGGLFGNLIDRIFRGYVVDFLDFYIFNYDFPVFNFADAFIFVGVMLILYAIYLGEDNENNSK